MEKIKPTGNRSLQVLLFIIPIICFAFIFRAIIFHDNIFAHLDVLINYFPYFHALATSPDVIQQGIISGFPILVSVSTTWFSPISWLFLQIFDAFTAFRVMDIAFIIGAYVFTYLYGRRIGLSHGSAILAGLVYIFAGQVMLWSEAIIITVYYLLLPLVLYILDTAYRTTSWRKYLLFVLAGILLGIGWLSGHVQFVIYVHLFIFSYWLFKTLNNKTLAERPSSQRSAFAKATAGQASVQGLDEADTSSWRPSSAKATEGRGRARSAFWFGQLGLIALMFGVSYLVGYPLIHAVQDFLPVTQRLNGVDFASAYGYAYLPYHFILELLPNFTIPYSPIPYSQAFQNYIGILPLLIFIIGLIKFKKIAVWKSESGFFLLVAAFCFVASLKYSPITFIFHYLPLLKTFREAPRIMFIGDFAIGLYVGFVLDHLIASKPDLSVILKWLRILFCWVALPVIAIFSIVYVFFFSKIESKLSGYFLSHMYKNTLAGLPTEHYTALIHSYLNTYLGQFSITSLGIIVFIVMSIASYWLLKRMAVLPKESLVTMAVLIVGLNFAAVYADYIHGFPQPEYMSPPQSFQAIMAVENSEAGAPSEPFRIFSPLNGIAMFNESVRCSYPTSGNWEISQQDFLLRRELMETNINMVYGIDSADGYEPYLPVRVSDLIGYVGSRFSVTNSYGMDPGSAPISLNDKVRLVASRKNVLRAMNVKYVLSYFQISDPDFRQIALEHVGSCASPVYIYELSNSWPRYFLTNNVQAVYASDEKDLFYDFVGSIASSTKPAIFIEKDGTASSTIWASDLTSRKLPPTLGITDIGNESSASISTVAASDKSSASLTSGGLRRGEEGEMLAATVGSDTISFQSTTTQDYYLFVGNAWLPDWTATIDGKPAKIEKANYIYMSLYVPKGSHDIVFTYK